MKITEELIEKIKMAEELDATEEQIMKMLDLSISPSKIKEEYEKYKDHITVSEAAEQLKSVLGELKSKKNYELKVLRLIGKGEIEAKKLEDTKGYRISQEEITRFIEDNKKSKAEWKNEALYWKKRYKEIKEELSSMKQAEEKPKKKTKTETKKKEDNRKVGVLAKDEQDGRYYINGTKKLFTSGRPITFLKNTRWIDSSVEHGGESRDYYIVALGKDVPIEGIKVKYEE